MSTKIYNGFIVDTGNFLTNWAVLGACKEPIQALVDAKHAKVLAHRIVAKADHWTLAHVRGKEMGENWEKDRETIPWYNEQSLLEQEQRDCRASLRRAPEVDCDVELFLRVHPERGVVLGYLQEERVGAYTHLIGPGGCREFGYWNNTDRPEELSDEQWEARHQLWNDVLRDEVACVSMRWEPRFVGIGSDMAQVASHVPTLQERAARRARQELEAQALWQAQQARQSQPGADKNSASMSWVMSCLRKVHEALQDPGSEMSGKLRALHAELEGLLVPDIAAHLNEPWVRWVTPCP